MGITHTHFANGFPRYLLTAEKCCEESQKSQTLSLLFPTTLTPSAHVPSSLSLCQFCFSPQLPNPVSYIPHTPFPPNPIRLVYPVPVSTPPGSSSQFQSPCPASPNLPTLVFLYRYPCPAIPVPTTTGSLSDLNPPSPFGKPIGKVCEP